MRRRRRRQGPVRGGRRRPGVSDVGDGPADGAADRSGAGWQLQRSPAAGTVDQHERRRRIHLSAESATRWAKRDREISSDVK